MVNWFKSVFQKFLNSIHHLMNFITKSVRVAKNKIMESRVSSDLHDQYEELGHILYHSIKNKSEASTQVAAIEIVDRIDRLSTDLDKIREQLRNIKNLKLPVGQNKAH